ncbi:trypsin-like serine protease [Streptomyces hygroscopicus]|uniref:trypsin-like serine protease n=1 Tax=Streptomyces hygroscopicus TaxID=1912 RepID=UPI000B183F5B|nr:trypsin-like serine protease [Streptomyces hygroscopicus]
MSRRSRGIKAVTLVTSTAACAATVLLGVPAPASAIAGGQYLDWATQAGGMVSILIDDPYNACSGALISRTANNRNSRLVLTARHCFEDDNGNLTGIEKIHVFNGHNTYGKGTQYEVNQLATLSVGNTPTDTVVLQLAQRTSSLAFTYNSTTKFPTGNDLRINGYGHNDRTIYNRELKQGTFTVTGNDDTIRYMIRGKGAVTCSGDSGGPAIDQNGVIVGTVFEGVELANRPSYESCDLKYSDWPHLSLSKLYNSNIDAQVRSLE